MIFFVKILGSFLNWAWEGLQDQRNNLFPWWQVLEAMQSGSVNGQLPTGVLIANEPDVARDVAQYIKYKYLYKTPTLPTQNS